MDFKDKQRPSQCTIFVSTYANWENLSGQPRFDLSASKIQI